MRENDAVLVTILAETDAIWRPLRGADWQARCGGILFRRRREFQARGVRSVGGGDGTARQAHARQLDGLAVAGDLLVYHGRGTGGVYVRLTDTAEHRLRALCDLPSLADAHALLRRVIELERPGGPDGFLCSELWLAGLPNYTGDYMIRLLPIQRSALPALSRGWLLAPSDCYGRTYYQSTATGRELAAQPAPILPPDLPEPDEEAASLYDELNVTYREQLRAMAGDGQGDIGPVPLPASLQLTKPRRRRVAQAETVGDG